MRARVLPGFLLLLSLAGMAFAAGSGAVPLDRLLPEIRRSTPGTFYDAQGPFMGPDGQMRYRIKWMTPDGRIIWFDADARSGRILGSYGGDNSGRRDERPSGDDGSRDRTDPSRRHFQNDQDFSGQNGNSGWPGSVYDGGNGNRGRSGGEGRRGGRPNGE